MTYWGVNEMTEEELKVLLGFCQTYGYDVRMDRFGVTLKASFRDRCYNHIFMWEELENINLPLRDVLETFHQAVEEKLKST